MQNLLSVIRSFNTTAAVKAIVPLGSGHIHETYHVQTDPEHADDYVLQQINTRIFRNPEAVMNNIGRVTEHIYGKLAALSEPDIKQKVLMPVRTQDGNLLYTNAENMVWRCFLYISGHKTYDRAINPEQVYEGGKAYGKFLKLISDLPVDLFQETIHGFHDLNLRSQQFEEACRSGVKDRIAETLPEIEILRNRQENMLIIHKLGMAGEIPVRLVHHDTKINNVLFDEHDKSLCVIDLDTVMPGYVHDDFGDSIRTFTNTGEEDDANLSRVTMNVSFFEAFARGFLEQTGSMLNPVEKKYLAHSAKVMTYMQALRFLTDYLNGDIYYRIHSPNHNLQRARAQIQLMMSMEQQSEVMEQIMERLT